MCALRERVVEVHLPEREVIERGDEACILDFLIEAYFSLLVLVHVHHHVLVGYALEPRMEAGVSVTHHSSGCQAHYVVAVHHVRVLFLVV